MKHGTWHWVFPKALCLLIACGFWVYVMNEQNPLLENTYTVPVEVRNLDKSLVAANVPHSVKVQLRMARNDMITLHSDNIKAYVDATDLSSGDFPDTPVHVSVPGNETVVALSPSSFHLSLDTYGVKTLPVELQTVGNVSARHTVGTVKVSPAQITVTGGNSRVISVKRAVVSVNLDGHAESFETFGDVVLFDGSGNAVSSLELMPEQVKITVPVTEEQKTVSLPVRVTVKGAPAQGHHIRQVTISPATATVTAAADYFDSHQEIIAGEIDLTGAEDSVKQTVIIPVPEQGKVTPSSVTVTAEIGKD